MLRAIARTIGLTLIQERVKAAITPKRTAIELMEEAISLLRAEQARLQPEQADRYVPLLAAIGHLSEAIGRLKRG